MELNNSKLVTLQSCGERYRRKYVDREPEPPTPSMIRGTVVHRVGKAALRRKLAAGSNAALPSDEEARDLAATWFDQEWDRQAVRLVRGDDEDDAETERLARAEAKDFAVEVSAFHVADLAPRLEPVAVERLIVVRPKNADLTIHGTLDLVTRGEEIPLGHSGSLPVTGNLEDIRDLKTSPKSPSKTAADTSQQLSMYGLIRYAEKGHVASRLKLDYLVRTPARHDLKHVELTTTRDAADFEAVVARINTAVEAVKRGVFVPADPSWWGCSEKWCGYWGSCPYTRRTRRPQT